MTGVGSELAIELPPALVAMTVTMSVRPSSVEAIVYVGFVASRIRVQLAPTVSHRNHWKANEVGLPDQVPVDAVRVFPTMSVPLTAGSLVLPGGAATDVVGAASELEAVVAVGVVVVVTGLVSHHFRTFLIGSPKTVLLQSTPPVKVLGLVNVPLAP